jgi:hypothetical protein
MRFSDIRGGKTPPDGHIPARPMSEPAVRDNKGNPVRSMSTGREARRNIRFGGRFEKPLRSRVQRLRRKRRTGGVK